MLKAVPLLLWVVSAQYYDTFTGAPISRARFEALNRSGLVPVCAVEFPPCDVGYLHSDGDYTHSDGGFPHRDGAYANRDGEFPRPDGSCANPRYPQRGTIFTPFRRLLEPVFSKDGGIPTAQSGGELPLVRPLRVDLISDGRSSSPRHTLMMNFYLLLVVVDVTSVHDTINYVAATRTCCQRTNDPHCLPIEVLPDDLHLRPSPVRCLNLTRSATYQQLGCTPNTVPPERLSMTTPPLDLSSVYGSTGPESRAMRAGAGGALRARLIAGREWPPGGGQVCVNNVPPAETECHMIPSATNSLLSVNIGFLWLFRQHNAICRHVRQLNPCWDDDRLYRTCRKINTALYLQILYYELLPELLGSEFLLQNEVIRPPGALVDEYDPGLEPRVSIEFVSGMRWFHSVQEGRHKLYTSEGVAYDEVAEVDFTLRTGALALNGTLAGLTRALYRQPGAAVDTAADPDIGERILGRLELVSDVISSDIMKGRDVGFPPYNHYRRLCGLPAATDFQHLRMWMDEGTVDVLRRHYKHPSDIEFMVGLLAEQPQAEAWVGATLACVMAEQLRWWRRSDRFWFERPGLFTKEQLAEIRKMTVAKLVCLYGDGVHNVQPQAFVLPSQRNKITDCSHYDMPDLSVFRDAQCYHNAHQNYPDLPPLYNLKGFTHDYPHNPYESGKSYENNMYNQGYGFSVINNNYCPYWSKNASMYKNIGYSYEKPVKCATFDC